MLKTGISQDAFISGRDVLFKGGSDPMAECDQEEADTRMCVHLLDVLIKGARCVAIRTVDTDVVVILVGLFQDLATRFPNINLWVIFGMGKTYKEYHINTIYGSLGPAKSFALPCFHAYTGCDTTSQFHGKGKISAWEAWNCFPAVTNAFTEITKNPFIPLDISSSTFKLLERYTCILYSKTTNEEAVNGLRKELFSQKSKTMENIPPTEVNSLFFYISLNVYALYIKKIIVYKSKRVYLKLSL